MILVNFF
jgi:hypothetical protein